MVTEDYGDFPGTRKQRKKDKSKLELKGLKLNWMFRKKGTKYKMNI